MNSVKLTLFIAGLAMTVNCVAETPTDTQCTNASVRAGLPSPTVRGAEKPRIESHWKGKKVAFLGDSISDPRNLGRRKFYWEYLAFTLGVDAHVYARSGARMDRMLTYAKDVKKDLDGHADALFVFAGTNDYNGGVPLGRWYDEAEEDTVRNGKKVRLVRRSFSMDENTFRGRINRLMDYLRRNFPEQQIVMMQGAARMVKRLGNVLAGISRKSFIGEITGEKDPALRTGGTLAGELHLASCGAAVIRTHNVRMLRDALKMKY